jgi:hypothetical protein
VRSGGKTICGVCQERPLIAAFPSRPVAAGGKSPTRVAMSAAKMAAAKSNTAISARSEITLNTPITARTNSLSAQHWICASCGTLLGKDALNTGNANILEGRLTCNQCYKKAPSALAAAGIGWKFFASVVVLSGAGIGLFPGHSMFLGIIAGVLLVLTGVLGFRLRSVTRTAITLGGAAIVAGCFFSLSQLGEVNAQRQALDALKKEAANIETLLRNDNFAEAQGRLPALEEKAKLPAPQDGYISADAEKIVANAREQLDQWLKKSYALSGLEGQVTMALLAVYPEKTATGEKRIRNIHIDGGNLALSLLALSRPSAADQPQTSTLDRDVMDEARGYLVLLFDKFPEFRSAELQLHYIPCPGCPTSHTFTVDREQAMRLKSVRDPAEILTPIAVN